MMAALRVGPREIRVTVLAKGSEKKTSPGPAATPHALIPEAKFEVVPVFTFTRYTPPGLFCTATKRSSP
jgi:hypothetical protein